MTVHTTLFGSTHPEVFCNTTREAYLEAATICVLSKNVFLKFRKIHKKTHVPGSLFAMPQACNFIKKETLAQVFSCEFSEIFKSTFFIEHLWWLLLSFCKANHVDCNWTRTHNHLVHKRTLNHLPKWFG